MTSEPVLANEERFLNLVAKSDALLMSLGLATRASDSAVRKAFQFSQRQDGIIRDLEFMISVLETPRKNFLSQFLEAFKMRLRDSSFESLIHEDDIVEIYNPQGVQIFRTLNYFKFCPYTLAEVLTYNWNELFDRPSSVVERLYEVTAMLFAPNAGTHAYDIPEYALSTRLATTRTFLLHMKYVTPLVSIETGDTMAFVTTASVREADTKKISFI